jgi:putative RecB family exonuclease
MGEMQLEGRPEPAADGALFDAGPGVVKLPAALSPSRAGDFQQCPLLYRLRVVDKVPEPPNAAATKGTLVHAVLERLFDLPADRRTPSRGGRSAAAAVGAAARGEARARRPVRDGRGAGRVARPGREAARHLLHAGGPDPPRTGQARDVRARPDGRGRGPAAAARLRGPAGHRPERHAARRRLQDRQGPAARVRGEDALSDEVLRPGAVEVRGVVPKRLQLLFLGNGEILTYDPTEADLLLAERKIAAVDLGTRSGRRPRPGAGSRRSRSCAAGAASASCARPRAARRRRCPRSGSCRRRREAATPCRLSARSAGCRGRRRPRRRF